MEVIILIYPMILPSVCRPSVKTCPAMYWNAWRLRGTGPAN